MQVESLHVAFKSILLLVALGPTSSHTDPPDVALASSHLPKLRYASSTRVRVFSSVQLDRMRVTRMIKKPICNVELYFWPWRM